MSLKFNESDARKSDRTSVIRDTGRYTGVITRAEKLKSDKGTEGVGLSFKADDESTANYLDVYTTRADGSQLWGHSLIQSLLCCAGVKDVDEGPITVEKWDKEVSEVVKSTVTGYPALMGKRIGLVLQRELQSHYQTGADVERVNIVRVFRAADGMTASEILDKKTKAEKIDQLMKALPAVKDSRKKTPLQTMAQQPGYQDKSEFDDMGDLRF